MIDLMSLYYDIKTNRVSGFIPDKQGILVECWDLEPKLSVYYFSYWNPES